MRLKTRAELPWLYYPECDSVRIINAHNFPPSGPALEILANADRAYIGEGHSGTLYDDSSSNTANRTLPGGVSWEFDATLNRYVIALDGTSGVPVEPLPAFGTTIGAAIWVKLASAATEQRAVALNQSGNPPYQVLRLGSPNSTSATLGMMGFSKIAAGLTLTNWNHFAWKATSNGQMELFVNGASVGTAVISPFATVASFGAYVGAARNNTIRVTGHIADFIISDGLTNDHIAWLASPANLLL